MKKSVYIIIPILTLALGLCAGYIASSYNPLKNSNQSILGNKEEIDISKEFYNKVKGEYLQKTSNGSVYGKVFDQNESGQYTYFAYLMHSGGARVSIITNIAKKSDNEYLVNYFSEAYEDMEGSGSEIKSYQTIDVSKLSDGLLVIDGEEYKKFTGPFDDWDGKDKFIGYNY